ncbi:hypothetical protein DH2020_044058 [Rehmannia glutinosa]|uniref:FBD domain-containing protein n=1 Tax=Rehmannia glutinosa TaxID=99300 RepID=A0ABR0UHX4_REHGL
MEKTIQSIDMHMNQIVPSIDRLSDLPDDAICHILSFLPTKISVATSILAKRWRFLWAHVPNLDFGRCDFSIKAEYSDIIHRIMLLHKVKSMTTFRLFHIYSDKYQLETWITIAIERNVQNIDLHIVVRLPRLLEELIIDESYIMDESYIIDGKLDCFNISSPTLKKLTVDFPFNLDLKVKINAPALRYLQVYDCSCVYIIVSPMPSLIEADICVNNCSLEEDEVVKFLRCLGLLFSYLEFLLSNLVTFVLSKQIPLHFLDIDVSGSIVQFDHLTRLELKLDIDWRSLIKLLEIAVNLEVLIVDVDVSYWMEAKQVPICLLLHLRNIRIDQMRYTDHEFNMVRYFLRNAKVLKRMEIYCQDIEIDFKAKFDALQRISLFERGSEACQTKDTDTTEKKIENHLPLDEE